MAEIKICTCADGCLNCPCRSSGRSCNVRCDCHGNCQYPPIKEETDTVTKSLDSLEIKDKVEGPRPPYRGTGRNKSKKLYYALYIGGRQVKVTYITNAEQWPRDQTPDLCIAWVEEDIKSSNAYHYFLLPLGIYYL